MPVSEIHSDPRQQKALLSRRGFLRGSAAAAATVIAGAGAYTRWVEPHWVGVTEVPMRFPALPESLVGKRLAQISDLHVGPVVDDAYLRRAMRQVRDLAPDYLAITGDLMTTEGTEQIGKTLSVLKELPLATTHTVAITGNHDYGLGYRRRDVAEGLLEGMRRLGIHALRNESVEIDGLQLAGCGDLWGDVCNMWRTLDRVDATRPAVCLAHNPDVADLHGWGRFRGWVLSGHTHGGQCRFPGIGAPLLPIRNRSYDQGHIALADGRDLYVNRGLGYSHKLRFRAPPEITLFTLQRA